jgi:hypothetical protein
MFSLLLHILGCRVGQDVADTRTIVGSARECSCMVVAGLAQHGWMYHSYGSSLATARIRVKYSCTASGGIVNRSELAAK